LSLNVAVILTLDSVLAAYACHACAVPRCPLARVMSFHVSPPPATEVICCAWPAGPATQMNATISCPADVVLSAGEVTAAPLPSDADTVAVAFAAAVTGAGTDVAVSWPPALNACAWRPGWAVRSPAGSYPYVPALLADSWLSCV
jgi:hypothetical protein